MADADAVLDRLRAIIQVDVNRRGLATDPQENLLTWCRDDFAAACRWLAGECVARVGIVTGFYIPAANAPETDGPLGTLLLAKVLQALGQEVTLFTELPTLQALRNGLQRQGRGPGVPISTSGLDLHPLLQVASWTRGTGRFDCLIAIERVGPSHTPQSLRHQYHSLTAPLPDFLVRVPREDWDQYHTMRGQIITPFMEPAHQDFEWCMENPSQGPVTIGIGDGGNEIGMGKIPWEVIARNVPNGAKVACRIATDHNIVCGVSNWGAYALAAGVWYLSGRPFDPALFSPVAERELWAAVLAEAVLVDGVTGKRELTVDGLSWEEYVRPLYAIGEVLRGVGPPA
jgi:hypothetical protein